MSAVGGGDDGSFAVVVVVVNLHCLCLAHSLAEKALKIRVEGIKGVPNKTRNSYSGNSTCLRNLKFSALLVSDFAVK